MPKRSVSNPYYKQVYEELMHKINIGEIERESYLPSEKELGSIFNVDRMTIRKALSMLVDEGLVEKRAGIGTFVKGTSVEGDNAKDINNILIVFPNPDNTSEQIDHVFRSSLLFTAEKECRLMGYNSIFTQDAKSSNLSDLTNGNKFKGILFTSSVKMSLLQECLMSKTPAVIIDNVFEGITSVISDNDSGIRQALRCFKAMGHTRIAFITGAQSYYNADIRLASFKNAMSEMGLTFPKEYIGVGNWTYEGGSQAMKGFMRLAEPPTAVLSSNDAMAIGAIHSAQALGISVPEGVSVIGFDNIDRSEFTLPKLTTVNVELAAKIHIACMHLIDNIEKKIHANCKITIPVQLVERDSVAKV